jgi:AraC family transcriptional regulator
MSNITAIFEAVEFIEAHLREEISVADIADAVGYSLYHFCRTFNGVIHHTPYDYLMRRRLSESAQELIETDRRIIEIAFDYQFNSPETYSRAFKRMFGTQPNQWRKQGIADRRFLMSSLTLAYIQHINKGDYLKPVMEERDALRVAGVMTLVKDDRTVMAQQCAQQCARLWEILAQELEHMGNEGELGDYYGIVSYPTGWSQHGFFYMAAVAVEGAETLGASLVVRTIPSSKYARFVHKGPAKDLGLTLDYIYQTWLPRSGEHLACPLEIEHRGQDFRDSDDQDSERVIYIPIQ